MASLTISLSFQTFSVLSLAFLVSSGLTSFRTTERSDGLCSTFVSPYKTYACQEYVAQTSDGFLLGIQRMSSLNYAGEKKGPVLLFHGILTGGDVWLINPPHEGLGFLLADAGYDVWISNYRSTRYSYGHIRFATSDEGFWDWSLDEIASEDLPASLELVYTSTNCKVLLVAYSEGSQATLAAFSEGLASNWVSKAALLAPVSYLTSAPQLLQAVSTLPFLKIFDSLNVYQFSTTTPGGREFVDLLCSATSTKCYHDWFRVFSGFNCCINSSRRAFIDKFETQATSVKNLDHYSQQLKTKGFAKYDYGTSGNMQRYKQANPPTYDVSKFPMSDKTLFISSDKDSLANVVDVAHLMKELPVGYQSQTVTGFGHLDFVFGDDANRVVYDSVMQFLAVA